MLARGVTEPFADMLKGGHPNSLGRTEEVVGIVLADRARLEELFETMGDPDEVVRMRVGDALEKVCREQTGWFVPHVDRLLGDLGRVEQPSVQWHVAQMLRHLRSDLSRTQAQRAAELLQRNLTRSTDWIVLNVTMDVLTDWANQDPSLAGWLTPELERLRQDERKSVAKRASKRLGELVE
jgi:HEAT repeat protein